MKNIGSIVETNLIAFGTVAYARLCQAHATKRTTQKTKPKARRRGAVSANPLGDRLPLILHAIFFGLVIAVDDSS